MDYERIHRVQMGVISPSKLRMKLLLVHNKRKEGRSNSSRTSPSKLEDMEYANNHLLTSDLDEQSSLEHRPKSELASKEKAEMMTHSKNQNLSTIHPVRSLEEDGNGYDSGHDNGSTSSFEFHRGERSLHHPAAGPFFRHVPSKWNDAEKWIVSRQSMHPNALKKNVAHSQGSRKMSYNRARNDPETIADTKRIESTDPGSQNVVAKFSFVPQCLQSELVLVNLESESADCSQVMGDSRSQARLEMEEDRKASGSEKPTSAVTATQTVESVSMRDVGTEMTPVPSQEPSRTGTPMGATTPSRSPRPSTPSTPKRGAAPASSPIDTAKVHEKDSRQNGGKPELSEKELKLRTRREIAALGTQLGKMNIASWASKETKSAAFSPTKLDVERSVKAEYDARAVAWEEAEKAKYLARYKREEVKIQALEDHQKAKIEAKIRKLEVRVERMRAHGQEKIARKLAKTRWQLEERRADAEARKNQKAARTGHKVEHIRQNGRLPPSHLRCCSWFL